MTTIMDDRDLIAKGDCDKNIKHMTQKIDNLENKINDFKIEIIKEIAELPDKLDGRYASKTTEKIVYGGVGIALSALIVALISLVIIK